MATTTLTSPADEVRRIRGDLSQTAFEKLTGVKQAHISQIENGVRPLTVEIAVRIEEGMGLPEDTLARLAVNHPATIRETLRGISIVDAVVCRLVRTPRPAPALALQAIA